MKGESLVLSTAIEKANELCVTKHSEDLLRNENQLLFDFRSAFADRFMRSCRLDRVSACRFLDECSNEELLELDDALAVCKFWHKIRLFANFINFIREVIDGGVAVRGASIWIMGGSWCHWSHEEYLAVRKFLCKGYGDTYAETVLGRRSVLSQRSDNMRVEYL